MIISRKPTPPYVSYVRIERIAASPLRRAGKGRGARAWPLQQAGRCVALAAAQRLGPFVGLQRHESRSARRCCLARHSECARASSMALASSLFLRPHLCGSSRLLLKRCGGERRVLQPEHVRGIVGILQLPGGLRLRRRQPTGLPPRLCRVQRTSHAPVVEPERSLTQCAPGLVLVSLSAPCAASLSTPLANNSQVELTGVVSVQYPGSFPNFYFANCSLPPPPPAPPTPSPPSTRPPPPPPRPPPPPPTPPTPPHTLAPTTLLTALSAHARLSMHPPCRC